MTAGPRDDPEFEPDKPPAAAEPTPTAKAEVQQFGSPSAPANSVYLHLGRLGHIAWQSESSTAVLGLIVLLLLCILTLLLVVAALFASDRPWLPVILQALGSAIAGVAGAIVGSSVAGARRRK
jgi:hypothetical protein